MTMIRKIFDKDDAKALDAFAFFLRLMKAVPALDAKITLEDTDECYIITLKEDEE